MPLDHGVLIVTLQHRAHAGRRSIRCCTWRIGSCPQQSKRIRRSSGLTSASEAARPARAQAFVPNHKRFSESCKPGTTGCCPSSVQASSGAIKGETAPTNRPDRAWVPLYARHWRLSRSGTPCKGAAGDVSGCCREVFASRRGDYYYICMHVSRLPWVTQHTSDARRQAAVMASCLRLMSPVLTCLFANLIAC